MLDSQLLAMWIVAWECGTLAQVHSRRFPEFKHLDGWRILKQMLPAYTDSRNRADKLYHAYCFGWEWQAEKRVVCGMRLRRRPT